MKLLVLGSALRTLGNFAPVLAHMRARGDKIDLAWVPIGATTGEDPAGLPADAWHVLARGGSLPGDDAAYWDGVTGLLARERHDLVLMDDMIHWPSARLAACVRSLARPPPLVAFQHGLYQAWDVMDTRFLADWFLCFGRRHVLNFHERHWSRVLPVGLPKLDRIAPRPIPADADGIMYVAQSAPSAAIIGPLLSELEQVTSRPVCIRPHPGHLSRYEALAGRHRILAHDEDIVAQIERCDWMLTTHSTAVLEAMRMGRDAVLLPSFGLGDFRGYPGIAVDFSADKVLSALKKHRRESDARERFLDDACLGSRHAATLPTLEVLDAIAAGRQDRLHRLTGDAHPLNRLRSFEGASP